MEMKRFALTSHQIHTIELELESTKLPSTALCIHTSLQHARIRTRTQYTYVNELALNIRARTEKRTACSDTLSPSTRPLHSSNPKIRNDHTDIFMCGYVRAGAADTPSPVGRSISAPAARECPATGPCRRGCWCWPWGARSPSACTPPAAASRGGPARRARARAAPPASPAPSAPPPPLQSIDHPPQKKLKVTLDPSITIHTQARSNVRGIGTKTERDTGRRRPAASAPLLPCEKESARRAVTRRRARSLCLAAMAAREENRGGRAGGVVGSRTTNGVGWDPWALNETFGGFETAGGRTCVRQPVHPPNLTCRSVSTRLTDGAQLPNSGPSLLPFPGTEGQCHVS